MKNNIVKIIGVIILIVLLFWLMASAGNMYAFLDLASLAFILVMMVSMLLFTNQWRDYLRAYQIAMGKSAFTTKEFKASLNVMDMCIKLVYLSGFIGAFSGYIQSLVSTSDVQVLATRFSVASLVLLYALVINVIQYAVKSMVKKELIYRKHES